MADANSIIGQNYSGCSECHNVYLQTSLLRNTITRQSLQSCPEMFVTIRRL